MEQGDDELVLIYLSSRSNAAFQELVRRHQAMIRSLLRRLCRDASLADDLAQNTFLSALGRLGTYRREDRFKAWLASIAYRQFLMAARSAKRLQELREAAELNGPMAECPDGRAEDLRLDLDKALSSLPAPENAVVVLNYGCGMSHSEIAAATGIPLGSVKTYIARGRQTLMTLFSWSPDDER